MKRIPITADMDPWQTAKIMAEGNRGAGNVLDMIVDYDPFLLLDLDDMNMRGVQVWHAYLGYCQGNFPRFCFSVKSRSDQMVAWVNLAVPHIKAVVRGGAPR